MVTVVPFIKGQGSECVAALQATICKENAALVKLQHIPFACCFSFLFFAAAVNALRLLRPHLCLKWHGSVLKDPACVCAAPSSSVARRWSLEVNL